MLTLLLILGVLCVILAVFRYNKAKSEYAKELLLILGGISTVCIVALLIAICSLVYDISTIYVIDEKITMYQEENAKIEEQIDVVVKEYLKYEADTYETLKTESSIPIATLYPELKANELVQKQIECYYSNNQIIKELKEKKIDIQKSKMLLYFGK